MAWTTPLILGLAILAMLLQPFIGLRRQQIVSFVSFPAAVLTSNASSVQLTLGLNTDSLVWLGTASERTPGSKTEMSQLCVGSKRRESWCLLFLCIHIV